MEINKNYANELTVGTQFFENIPGGDYAGEIYVMNADGTGQTNISNNPANDFGPSWSPDGTKIIFASYRDAITNRDLYVMNADGSNPTRLTNDPEDETWPSWSPDGTKIAFTRNGQIYVMNADGSEQTNISGGRFGIDPDWGPAVDTD
jgi:TolB protein